MNIKEYFRPLGFDDAYEILQNHKGLVLGGGAFLNLQNSAIDAAVDLSKLNLDFIQEKDGQIEIGAMTSLRKIENNNILKENFNGLLSKTCSVIMGVQIRNMATIGGTVWGRYGFSDLLTSLLALETYVELYKGGTISLDEFLESGRTKDILTKIIIKREDGKACFKSIKNTSTDFSILNAAVSKIGNGFRISVGARPKRAKLAVDAMEFINNAELNEENAAKAGKIAAESLGFGSDIRGSMEYRKELCKVLVKRCIMEVLK